MNTSKNGIKYYQFDYDDFTEKGLKSFIKVMKQAGAEVTSVSATNRQRRVNGLPQKMAVLHLINGQSVTLRIGSGGDLAEVKLNTQKIPLRDSRTAKAIANGIADAAKRNQAKFDKSQARKLAKLKTDTGPTGQKSSGNSLKQLQARLADRQEETARLIIQRDQLSASITSMQGQIDTTKDTITTLQAEEAQLMDQLEALEAENND